LCQWYVAEKSRFLTIAADEIARLLSVPKTKFVQCKYMDSALHNVFAACAKDCAKDAQFFARSARRQDGVLFCHGL
jgi:hypothetical protein